MGIQTNIHLKKSTMSGPSKSSCWPACNAYIGIRLMIKYWTFPQMLHQPPVRTTKERNHETSVSLRNHQLLFVCFIYKFCICTLQPRISKSSAMINWTNHPYWSNIMKNFYIHMIKYVCKLFIKDRYMGKTELPASWNYIIVGMDKYWLNKSYI